MTLALLTSHFLFLKHLPLSILLILFNIFRQILPNLEVFLRILLLYSRVLAFSDDRQLIFEASHSVLPRQKLLLTLFRVIGILIIGVFAGAAQKSSFFLAVDRQLRSCPHLIFWPLWVGNLPLRFSAFRWSSLHYFVGWSSIVVVLMQLLSIRLDRDIDFLVDVHVVFMLSGREWFVELWRHGQFRQF